MRSRHRTWMVLIPVVILTLAPAMLNAQVQVTTLSGDTYVGTVLDENMEHIMILTSDSVTITIPRSNLQLVQYGVGPRRSRSQSTLDPGASFWSFGGAFGSPAIINLVLGYNFSEWGVRASGGVVPESSVGVQFDLRRNIGVSGTASHNLHIGAGALLLISSSPFRSYDWWDYIALGYDLNWGGFYLAGDISFGEGTFSSPQILGQIGYVHEFR